LSSPLSSGFCVKLPVFFDRCRCLLRGRTSKLTNQLEFKEIRKEWKARKKEEENQRKAAEERERAAAAQAQAQGQVDGGPTQDPSQAGQPPSYPGGVRPQLPPIGYQPADSQVPGQYNGGNMVYPQSNGQIPYAGNYPPHSPYGQGYQQRKVTPLFILFSKSISFCLKPFRVFSPRFNVMVSMAN
jgi:hypothetical protein